MQSDARGLAIWILLENLSKIHRKNLACVGKREKPTLFSLAAECLFLSPAPAAFSFSFFENENMKREEGSLFKRSERSILTRPKLTQFWVKFWINFQFLAAKNWLPNWPPPRTFRARRSKEKAFFFLHWKRPLRRRVVEKKVAGAGLRNKHFAMKSESLHAQI